MKEWLGRAELRQGGSDRDPELARMLSALDPASLDEEYWMRFRRLVVSRAGVELARRRMDSAVTVADVLSAWSRLLLPSAAAAAAVAAFLLVRTGQGDLRPIGVEELLVTDLPAETVPVLLSPDAAAGLLAFASDLY